MATGVFGFSLYVLKKSILTENPILFFSCRVCSFHRNTESEMYIVYCYVITIHGWCIKLKYDGSILTQEILSIRRQMKSKLDKNIFDLFGTIMNFLGKHYAGAEYRQVSHISRAKSINLNVSCLILQFSLHNLLKPGVKSRMKM